MSKIPAPVAVGLLVALILVIIVGGVMYARHSTGNDLADQMHAYMRAQKPGQAPFTPAQMQQMSETAKH